MTVLPLNNDDGPRVQLRVALGGSRRVYSRARGCEVKAPLFYDDDNDDDDECLVLFPRSELRRETFPPAPSLHRPSSELGLGARDARLKRL